MRDRETWMRGGITLAVVALVAGALLAAPAGAAKTGLTRKKARRIATNVFNRNIGPVAAGFQPAGSVVVQAHQNAADEEITDTTQINSLSITAPSNGFLIINGSAEIDNDDDNAGAYMCLRPRVGGANVVAGPFTSPPPSAGEAACSDVDDHDRTVDSVNISYSVVHGVTPGTHTVTQDVVFPFGASGDIDVYQAQLVTLFVPTGGVTTLPTQFRTARGPG